MFHIHIDEECGAVRVVSHGTWSPDDADRYVAEFSRFFREARDRFGRVRVLVDARAASPHAPATSRRLVGMSRLFDRRVDRLAIVTPSSLKKQEVTRDGLPEFGMAFLSTHAAETWLFAYDQADIEAVGRST